MSEDRVKQTEPEIDDFSILIDRLPLIFAQLDQVDNLAQSFIMFKYPRLSWFWCCVLVVFILTFDPRYLLSYLIAVITIVYGSYMPQVAKVINPYLQKLFFDHPNIYYKQIVKIATSSQISVIEAKKQVTEKYKPKDKNGVTANSAADKRSLSEKAVKHVTNSRGSDKDDFEASGFDEA
jgi:hypothetical protein